MRNERFWLERIERRNPWARVGPNLLALAIVGVGVGGAIRIVRAQDTPSAPPVPPAPLILRSAGNGVVVVQADEQERKAEQEAEVQASQQELDALMKERAALDARIRSLQDKNRAGNRVRSRVFVLPKNGDQRKLTPEERKQVEEAMRTAQEAMKMAQKALEGIQNFLPEGLGKTFVMPKVNFRFDSKAFDGKEWNKQDWEKFSRDFEKSFNSKDTQKWAEEFQKKWKANQPEFERKMREFESKMEKQSRELEDNLRKKLKDREKNEEREPHEDDEKDEKATEKPKSEKKTIRVETTNPLDVI